MNINKSATLDELEAQLRELEKAVMASDFHLKDETFEWIAEIRNEAIRRARPKLGTNDPDRDQHFALVGLARMLTYRLYELQGGTD